MSGNILTNSVRGEAVDGALPGRGSSPEQHDAFRRHINRNTASKIFLWNAHQQTTPKQQLLFFFK